MTQDFFRAVEALSSETLEQSILLSSAEVPSSYPSIALKPVTPNGRRTSRQQAEPKEAIGRQSHD
jgi:hypothetical protein